MQSQPPPATVRYSSAVVLTAVIGLLASFGMLALPATAASKPGKPGKPKPEPKPDLVIKGFEFVPAPGISDTIPHVVLDSKGMGKFSLEYTVKNVGKGDAPPTNVRVNVAGDRFDDVKVRGLASGRQALIKTPYDVKFTTPGISSASVCADFPSEVKETKEKNNCNANKEDVKIRAVPRVWIPIFFNLTQRTADIEVFTHMGEMKFEYGGISANRQFYWLASGALKETISGSDGQDCTYAGDGTSPHSPWSLAGESVGYLSITENLNLYSAEFTESPGTGYEVIQTCTEPDPDEVTPFTANYNQLFTGPPGTGMPMASTTKYLDGSYETAVPTTTYSYSWSIGADLP